MKTYSHIIVWVGIVLLLVNCENLQVGKNKSNIPQKVEPIEQAPIDPIGTTYSKEEVEQLIQDQLPKEKLILDTFEVVHNIPCALQRDFQYLRFSMDDVVEFQSKGHEPVEVYRQLLEQSHCVLKIKSTDKYDAYVFYSDILESHSSKSLNFIIIDKSSNSFERIALAKEYGNELGSYVISSKINKDLLIERFINHNVSYIHGVGEVDSIYRIEEKYQIMENGTFGKIEEQKILSNKVNRIFE